MPKTTERPFKAMFGARKKQRGPLFGADGIMLADDGGKAELLARSEEHTSELQSRQYLVCRLLLEKKKNKHQDDTYRKHRPHLQITRQCADHTGQLLLPCITPLTLAYSYLIPYHTYHYTSLPLEPL